MKNEGTNTGAVLNEFLHFSFFIFCSAFAA